MHTALLLLPLLLAVVTATLAIRSVCQDAPDAQTSRLGWTIWYYGVGLLGVGMLTGVGVLLYAFVSLFSKR